MINYEDKLREKLLGSGDTKAEKRFKHSLGVAKAAVELRRAKAKQ